MVDIRWNDDAFEEILSGKKTRAEVDRISKAIAAACNKDSSWGGYYGRAVGKGRARGRVWNVKKDASDDETRNNRMIRNLRAGG